MLLRGKKKECRGGESNENQIQVDLSLFDAIKVHQPPLKYMLKLSHVVTETV